MKRKGDSHDCKKGRDLNLLRVFNKIIGQCDNIDMIQVAQQVVNSTAERFWVTEQRAYTVLSRMMSGDKLENMRPTTRQMYYDLLKRVKEYAKVAPHRPMIDIVMHVVFQPAPKFYMTPKSAITILCAIKRKLRKQRSKLI